MNQRIGLIDEIDRNLHLLKVHLPYHESDHVLNFAYNTLVGGQRLEDMELRRQDESFLNGLGAQRTPDPTTAGDFTRRFGIEDALDLMDCINRTRVRIWKVQEAGFLEEALIDIDGTIAGTLGECKGGMDISYKGIWGYAPLIISLANTKEVLHLVNRPGNTPSSAEAAPWIDLAIELVKPHAQRIFLRGDTDFALTANFDRWDEEAVGFCFGIDAMPKAVAIAQGLKKGLWQRLKRLPKYEAKGPARRKPERVKEQIVREREFTNQRLICEDVAEFEYQPGKCKRAYRVVVVRKNLSVEKGDQVLFDDIRYFFYITNNKKLDPHQVVNKALQRCDQENVIEQLKNGVNAMRMPVNDLISNWAYMIMAALSWNMKAWFGMLMPDRERGREIMRMEFRRFLQAIILLPCQIIRAGRRIVYRVLGYNDWLRAFFATWERVRQMSFG